MKSETDSKTYQWTYRLTSDGILCFCHACN